MVPQELENGEHRQPHPHGQTAPGAELRCAEFQVEARGVDPVGLVDVVASGDLAGGEPVGHALAPGHESEGDEEGGDEGDGREEYRADDVDEGREEGTVLALVHVHGESVDLNGGDEEEGEADEDDVVAVGLGRPCHDQLGVGFLPNAGGEE